MRRNLTVFLHLLVIIFIVLCSSVLLSCKRSSHQNQKEVILYCSVDQAIAEPIISEFEKQTGIKVLPRFDTEADKTIGLVQRIRAEAASPVADVFWSSEIFHMIRLARESLLESYISDNTKNWPVKLADSKGRWYGFALRARVIAYNTDRVNPNEAPKSLEDVLDSKWQGRVVMATPEFGTTGGDVASWFAHYGFDRARKILEALKVNRIRLVPGNSTAVRMIVTGQADICFTDTDDVYAAQRNGWPVALNYLDQGGDGVLVIPNTAAIIKNCSHPEETKILMEFLLSSKLEQMLAQSDSHNFPSRPELAKQFSLYAIPKSLDVDYEKVADQLSTAIQSSREILQ